MKARVVKFAIIVFAFLVLVAVRVRADIATPAPTPVATAADQDAVDQAVDGVAAVLQDDDRPADKPPVPPHPPQPNYHEKGGSQLEDILVPIAAFIFVIVIVLGGRFLKEQSARKRLDLLKMMIEKGQPIPDNVVKELISNDEPKKNSDPKVYHMKQLRNGLVLTGLGLALFAYRFMAQGERHDKALAIGLVSLGLGVGLLIAYKLSDKHIQP